MNRLSTSEPDNILDNYLSNHLYKSDFGDGSGSYFTIVTNEDESIDIAISSKISLKITYIKDKDLVKAIQLIKLRGGKQIECITLTISGISQLCEIVRLLENLNLSSITERRTTLTVNAGNDVSKYELLRSFLSDIDASDTISQLLSEGLISSHDIVNTGYRRQQLEIYHCLLYEKGYLSKYASEHGVSDTKEEKVWQFFFEKNEWILGYGMDYKFMSVLQREAHISSTNLNGSNSVITDYLMGNKFFTTFVEIKKPTTHLFGNKKNRSSCWCLSDDLIDAVSQILEHKAAGQIKLAQPQYDGTGELITQKAYDSKVVLLIGNWKELASSSSTFEAEIKKKTFELYRRDSRNIDMLTYDELYDRARFIVEGE